MRRIGRLVSISVARSSAVLAGAVALRAAFSEPSELGIAALSDAASVCTVMLCIAALVPPRANPRLRWMRLVALGIVVIVATTAPLRDQASSSYVVLHGLGLGWGEAAGFVAIAVLLGLLEARLRPAFDALFHVILVSTVFVAGMGLAWHLGDITGWPHARALPVSSAAGTLLLALSAALQWDGLRRTDAGRPVPAATQLRFLIVNAIALTVFLGTVSASILFEDSVRTVQQRNLAHLAAVQARSIHETLRAADAAAESLSTRLHLLRHIRSVNRREDVDGTVPAIREILETVVTGDVAGLALFALNGDRIAQAGHLGDSKDLHIVLDHARLLHWDNVPVLQRRLALLAGGEVVGAATIAIRLPGIATVLGDAYGLAPSAETLLCAAHDSKTMVCLPHRFSASMTLRDRTRAGSPLPVALALDGMTDTLDSIDYRGRTVLASVTPVPPFSLALLSKVDKTDLASPLAGKAIWLAGIVFALAIGLIVLHHLGPSRIRRIDPMKSHGGRPS